MAISRRPSQLRALADRTDQPLDQLRLGETVCTEANAWNRVLDRLHQLEHTTQAATMRSLLNGTAGPAAADDDADAGGRAALDSVVDLLPTGVLLLDSAGRIRNANRAGAALLSSDRSAIMGVDVRTLLSDAAFAEAIASTLARSHGGERRVFARQRGNAEMRQDPRSDSRGQRRIVHRDPAAQRQAVGRGGTGPPQNGGAIVGLVRSECRIDPVDRRR